MIYFILIFFILYVLPTLIAMKRKHYNRWNLFAINIFLGWTIIGWIIVFIIACNSNISKICNNCGQEIKNKNTICPFCNGTDLILAIDKPKKERIEKDKNNNEILKFLLKIFVKIKELTKNIIINIIPTLKSRIFTNIALIILIILMFKLIYYLKIIYYHIPSSYDISTNVSIPTAREIADAVVNILRNY